MNAPGSEIRLPHYTVIGRGQLAALEADLPRDDLLHLLTLIKLNPVAQYADEPEVAGLDAYQRYCETLRPVLDRLRIRTLTLGPVEQILIGPAGECWDVTCLVEYPNGESFLELLRDPLYAEAQTHWTAAVQDARMLRVQSAQTW